VLVEGVGEMRPTPFCVAGKPTNSDDFVTLSHPDGGPARWAQAEALAWLDL
jgi:hypothetical protein